MIMWKNTVNSGKPDYCHIGKNNIPAFNIHIFLRKNGSMGVTFHALDRQGSKPKKS
jgi:hypothetical protein